MSLFVLTTGWSHLAIQSTELVAREAGSRSHELVFGSIDGILAVLGIISAAGSALLRPEQIFTTALGGAVAGSLSVFAATYLSETTEKKVRLLDALESTRRKRNGRTLPARGIDHPHVRRMLARINRRALISGTIISSTSMFSSLVLLLPLILLSPIFSVTASMMLGIFLLVLLGAFRGLALKQSAAKSAVKMVVLGIAIILLSRSLGTYVEQSFLR